MSPRPLTVRSAGRAFATSRLGLLVLGTLGACAASQKHLDRTGAVEHRFDAAQARAKAQVERDRYDPGASTPRPNTTRSPDGADLPDSTRNPTRDQLVAAHRNEAHARMHEAEAQRLDDFESAECRGLAPQIRNACPLIGPVARVTDVEHGVRLDYDAGQDIQPILGRMRCHLAYARAQGYGTNGCPLYLRGVDIRLSSDGHGIELIATDGTDVRELRRRSRELSPSELGPLRDAPSAPVRAPRTSGPVL